MLLITVLNFVIMRLAPGGPAQFAEDPRIGPEYRAAMLEAYGLNDPVYVQYVKWLGNVIRLDFGYQIPGLQVPRSADPSEVWTDNPFAIAIGIGEAF